MAKTVMRDLYREKITPIHCQHTKQLNYMIVLQNVNPVKPIQETEQKA